MSKIFCAFFCAEVRHERANAMAKSPHRPRSSFAQSPFEFGEGHLDGIEIGRVLRQVTQFGAGGFDGLFYTSHLVGPKMVHHDNIAAVERGNQALLNIGQKSFSVHGSFNHQWRRHSIAAQAGHECQRLSGSKRHTPHQSLATWAATIETSHAGVQPEGVTTRKSATAHGPCFNPGSSPPKSIRPLPSSPA
jgi:hypothetical protein